jgi:hypothetical protein
MEKFISPDLSNEVEFKGSMLFKLLKLVGVYMAAVEPNECSS